MISYFILLYWMFVSVLSFLVETVYFQKHYWLLTIHYQRNPFSFDWLKDELLNISFFKFMPRFTMVNKSERDASFKTAKQRPSMALIAFPPIVYVMSPHAVPWSLTISSIAHCDVEHSSIIVVIFRLIPSKFCPQFFFTNIRILTQY